MSGTINDVAVNGDTCVGVTNGGIYCSIDRGVTWARKQTGSYRCVIYANGMFVAAGDSGNVATSLDGLTWVKKPSHGTDTIYRLIYDGTGFCGVTRSQTVKFSQTLETWNISLIVSGFVSTDIDHHDGMYLVCGSNGEIYKSTNGVNWTSVWSGTDNKYTKIKHLHDQTWYALVDATHGMMYYTTDNGASWGARGTNNGEIVTDIQYLDGEYTLTTTTNILKGTSMNGLTVVPNSENTHFTSIDGYLVAGSGGAVATIGADKGWYTFDQVPIGSVYIYGGGGIDDIYTNPYNNNGYDVTTYTVATPATYGVMRVAAPEDEIDCSCSDASITPSNLYDLANFRRANTEYSVDDEVGCPYHHNLQLKCIQAGVTSNEALDTKGVLEVGDIIEDGSAIWEVKTYIKKGVVFYEVYDEITINHPKG